MQFAALGAHIRQLRQELELTQRQLADRAGCSREWVVRIEGGTANASLGTIVDILEAFGRRSVELLASELSGDQMVDSGSVQTGSWVERMQLRILRGEYLEFVMQLQGRKPHETSEAGLAAE